MTQRLEELRIALVMNGGVSLAVWIGGATNEVFRLVTTDSHSVYTEILRLTSTVASVDVISGTSAGGINGAALATAMVYKRNFNSVRDIWLETGAFEDLLRAPFGENPGSILKGDQYFLPRIKEALEELSSGDNPAPAKDLPIDLQLTATLLTGQRVRTVDSLGTKVQDVDYRSRFHFRRGPNCPDDFVNRDRLVQALSRAARSTSSFPFAFEPSVVDGGQSARLFDATGTPLYDTRHVIDGGILDNKPIRGALNAIFGMRRTRSVRRVLAYVNPDPGDGPLPESTDTMPSLASVLSASVLGIPQSQSITDQLQEIADHNRAVQTRRNSVLNIVRFSRPDGVLAQRMFQVYRKRRVSNTCEQFVFGLIPWVCTDDERATDMASTGEPAQSAIDPRAQPTPSAEELEDVLKILGKQSRASMKSEFERIPWSNWIPLEWPATAGHISNSDSKHWEWGLFPVEFMTRVALDMLRIVQKLSDVSNSLDSLVTQFLGERPAQMPTADNLDDRPYLDAIGLEQFWGDRDTAVPVHFAPAQADDGFAQLWTRAYRILAFMEAFKNHEQADWKEATNKLIRDLVDRGRRANGQAHQTHGAPPLPESEDFIAMFSFLGNDKRKKRCAHIAYRVARLIMVTCRAAYALTIELRTTHIPTLTRDNAFATPRNFHIKLDELNQIDLDLVSDLEALTQYLCGCELEGPSLPAQEFKLWRYDFEQSLEDFLFKLLQLEVVEYSLNNRDEHTADTLIEFVQLSGDSQGPLATANYRTARQKLMGLQLAHFGAFYKQSWRANDWIYGRLDGAERLVKILLNAERLQMNFLDADTAVNEIRRIALDSIESGILKSFLKNRWSEQQYEPRLARELAFLNENANRLPDLLPVCAEVLTLRLHMGILREEIPVLLQAIRSDQNAGSDNAGRGKDLMYALGATEALPHPPFTPRQAAEALENGLIAGESLLDEVGSDLFTRTLAHTVAATQSALASEAAKLGALSYLSASLRVPILGFYFAAKGVTRQSRTSAALNAGVLAVGAVIVLLHMLSLQLLPGLTAEHVGTLSASATAASSAASATTSGSLPGIIVTLGWSLFAYGLIVTILREGILLLVLLLGVVGICAHYNLFGAIPGALVVIIFLAALAALCSRWTWLQIPVGLIAILVAGAASAGKAGCSGQWLLRVVGQKNDAPQCELPSLSDHTVFMSIVVIVTLIVAITQEKYLRPQWATWRRTRRWFARRRR
ncbi:patatin-like protein [Burkholderia ubonensis]|uniref:patatin-like protein n=1 Tax=Burkholderia ubonensis TaxID=101571 RepID=UPI00359018AC